MSFLIIVTIVTTDVSCANMTVYKLININPQSIVICVDIRGRPKLNVSSLTIIDVLFFGKGPLSRGGLQYITLPRSS